MIMVILGARARSGPALGSALIVFLEERHQRHTQRWLLVLGLIYVAVTLFAPAGILGRGPRPGTARVTSAPRRGPDAPSAG
jgi:ABC-type branched-subunit amino acid transport system permease subunit